MLRFGFVRILGRLTVYDITKETRMGRDVYVAALSEDPRYRFEAPSSREAVVNLVAYMSRVSGAPAVVVHGGVIAG